MEDEIKIITDLEKLEGTCYMEVLPGRYSGKFWNKESVFFTEETFGFLEPLIEKRHPEYDHFSFCVLPADTWNTLIGDFERLKTELVAAETMEQLSDKIGFVFKGAEPEFSASFSENKSDLIAVIDQFNIWLRDTLKSKSEISILGI